MFSSVRAGLLDAVGTLIEPRPSVAAAYTAAGRRFGCGVDEDEIRRRFRVAMARRETEDRDLFGLVTSESHERRRWRHVVREVFPTAGEPDGLFEALWNHFASAENWSLVAGAAQGVEQLLGRGQVLAAASNFDARLESICRQTPPLDRLDHVFTSAGLGHRKPSREFFAAIERRLNLRPDELLLVGDDLENDFRGARAAGWHAVLVGRRVDASNAVVVPSLAELPALLGM